MIAAKDKTVACAANDSLHAAAVRLDARCLGIVQAAAVHGAPEIRIQLEISAPPLIPHGPEERFQVLLNVRVCPVERVPGTSPPPAEGHHVGRESCARSVLDEPVRVFLKYVRL